MRNFFNRLWLLPLLMNLAAWSATAQNVSNGQPDFDEIRDLVRAHLAGVTEAELNRTAVESLLSSLRGKVQLISKQDDQLAPTNLPAISKSTVLEDHIAWLRVDRVSASLPGEITRQCHVLAATNKLTGLILDLRFAGGDDYAAAAAAAALFVATERPLLDWSHGTMKSVAKANAVNWPVVVLMNSETTGAAEALAAVLRDAGVALLLGGTTRGAAMTTQDFPLRTGQILRIATSPVKLGDVTPISAKGVKPDIDVIIAPDSERAYRDDPYAAVPRTNQPAASLTATTSTNRPARRTRPNEADLVRARRDGLSLDGDFPVGRDAEPEEPVIRDPALARAVDLLKGLAVVRRPRS